ncbi:hypothetical protein Tco_0982796 [Tanacetum coccineum]
MASLDRRLNPLYAIKECSSCGNLHTKDCGCSKGSLEDKILVPTLEEVFQDFQDTSESSNDDTNFVNQEPFVVNQDPGKNSSQSPPQINHNCCYECGDSLDDIFCQRCTCKSCGKGAHYGYNCPPQIPIISNPEPCYNQNLNEILQNLQSLQQQCLLGTCQQCGCNEYDGVCFYCTVGNGTPINFSTPYSSNDSPSVANHPPQPQYVPYSCELCGNDSHYGYDCPPQVPFIPICYDDDEDYTIAITPVLSTEEPVNSLSMGDEHLNTIPVTESDEVIKSSVEDLVLILMEERIHMKNIDYVDASPPDAEIVNLEVVEIVIPEVGGIVSYRYSVTIKRRLPKFLKPLMLVVLSFDHKSFTSSASF